MDDHASVIKIISLNETANKETTPSGGYKVFTQNVVKGKERVHCGFERLSGATSF